MKNPLVSIVITTKNEEAVIETLLNSIKKQTFKDFETILIDNNSTDKTVQIAKKFGAIVYNKGPERSVQRNFGVGKAKGKYAIILDADMKLTKNVLKESVVEFNKNMDIKALVIPEKSYGTGFWVKFKIFEREFYVGDETIEAARFFEKSTFKKFGGYDINITGPEDYDLPLRIIKSGEKLGRIKSYIYHNEKRFSPISSAKKKFYYASRAGAYAKRHPEMKLIQGNMIFRPIFFKNWKKLASHPFLSLGMFLVKGIEMIGAMAGYVKSNVKKTT